MYLSPIFIQTTMKLIDEERKKKNAERMKKYYHTEKGHAANKKYRQSERGKELAAQYKERQNYKDYVESYKETAAANKLRNSRKYAGTEKGKLTSRKAHLKLDYGLTLEEFDAMEAAQQGKCYACGQVPTTRLCVDHNHTTGQVRGLLCKGCNTALGMANENPATLQALAEYIRKFEEPNAYGNAL